MDVMLTTPQEREQNRVAEQFVGIPVPQLMEAVVEVKPQERVQNRTPEQIVDVPVPQITRTACRSYTRNACRIARLSRSWMSRASDHGGPCGSLAVSVTGTRAESHAGANRGFPRASDHGGNCGSCAVFVTGTRAESHA